GRYRRAIRQGYADEPIRRAHEFAGDREARDPQLPRRSALGHEHASRIPGRDGASICSLTMIAAARRIGNVCQKRASSQTFALMTECKSATPTLLSNAAPEECPRAERQPAKSLSNLLVWACANWCRDLRVETEGSMSWLCAPVGLTTAKAP